MVRCGMTTESTANDRSLNSIIVYGLSLSFSVLLASLEALRSTRTGFNFEITWRTFLALVIAGAVFVPCFRTIVYSRIKSSRRIAITIVIIAGISSFFYPLRFVPREKMGAIFTGLGLAVLALSGVAGGLLMVRRWFEGNDARNESGKME
jgi:lysylphosphatidylglycerol synthetase-like protein (DUF2156 family)